MSPELEIPYGWYSGDSKHKRLTRKGAPINYSDFDKSNAPFVDILKRCLNRKMDDRPSIYELIVLTGFALEKKSPQKNTTIPEFRAAVSEILRMRHVLADPVEQAADPKKIKKPDGFQGMIKKLKPSWGKMNLTSIEDFFKKTFGKQKKAPG
jgi:hypothetical protein